MSTEPLEHREGMTIARSYLGWIIVTSTKNPLETTITNAEFIDYRTRNLIPYQGYEITPDFHPFNCGLAHLVHEDKGCYIGQEVLTRMRSRGKMGKQLMQVAIDSDDAISIGSEFALAIRRTPS